MRYVRGVTLLCAVWSLSLAPVGARAGVNLSGAWEINRDLSSAPGSAPVGPDEVPGVAARARAAVLAALAAVGAARAGAASAAASAVAVDARAAARPTGPRRVKTWRRVGPSCRKCSRCPRA